MKNNLIVSKSAALAAKARGYIAGELMQEGLSDIQSCHGDMLHFVLNDPGIAVTELSRRCRRVKSTVSKMSDKLADLGYVRKEKSPEDPRVTRLYPTEKCRGIEKEFNAIADRLCERVAANLSDDEVRVLESLLDKALSGFGSGN